MPASFLLPVVGKVGHFRLLFRSKFPAFTPDNFDLTMPEEMRTCIRTAYGPIRTIADGRNPVQKRLFVITGESATVYMSL